MGLYTSADTGISPAMTVFGRQVRDPLPLQPGKFFPRQEWRLAAKAREDALAKTRSRAQERMTHGSRNLPPLQPGDRVYIQDQHGNTPKQWNKTGVVIEVGPHHSYQVSVDGSRSVTKRNRKFLRKISPVESPAPAPVQPHLPLPKPSPAPVIIPAPAPVNLDPQHTAPAADPYQVTESEPVTTPEPPAPIPPITLRRTGDQWRIAPPITHPLPPAPPMLQSPMVTPIMPGPYYPHMLPGPMFQGYPSYMPYHSALMSVLPSSWSPHYQSPVSIGGEGASTGLYTSAAPAWQG